MSEKKFEVKTEIDEFKIEIVEENIEDRCKIENETIKPDEEKDKPIEKEKYKCSFCKENFDQQSELTAHLEIHLLNSVYNCTKCSESFTNYFKLKEHLKEHYGNYNFYCNVCQKAFNRKRLLSDHLKTHLGVKPHKCKLCPLSFTQKGNLNSHILVHRSDKNIHKCSLCDRGFTRKQNLKRHYLSHSEHKRYKCPYCKGQFSYSYGLAKHMKIHQNETPEESIKNSVSYQCQYCDMSFGHISSLTKHITTRHEEETDYKCPICAKCFARRGYLGRHLKISHNTSHNELLGIINTKRKTDADKIHNCKYCKSRFTCTRNLRRHMNILHPEIAKEHNSFKCKECDKAFDTKSGLSCHIASYHKKCLVCFKRFAEKEHLQDHIKKCPGSLEGKVKIEDIENDVESDNVLLEDLPEMVSVEELKILDLKKEL